MGTSTATDVLVVGSGAAGLCAALEASAAGARVIVLDSESEVGGSSRMSAGIIMGAGTRRQSALGIEDSAESLFHDYMALNQWKVDAAVVHRLAQECGPSVDWLEDHGVEFMEHLYFSGDERVPRCHVPATGDAAVVIDALHEQLHKRPGVEFRMDTRVDGLIIENGRVVGVAAAGREIRGHTVVVTTGGFGADPKLVDTYFPKARDAGDWCWYIGAPGARGDALALAEQAGLQTIGHDRGLFLLSPNFMQCIEGAFPGWLIIVNSEGRRFFDETAPYSVTEPLARSQPGPLWAIFDNAAKRAAQPEGYGDAKKQSLPVGFLKSNWVEPVLDEMLGTGLLLRADSIAGLARQLDIPAGDLEGTIEGYNENVDAGEDRLFRKPARVMRRVDSPPYYATELRLSVLCLTSMGLRIDPDARVYDTHTRPVPGLYAAGECTGGVLGDVYVGSGNSWANCVTYGRIAGRSAAREALATKDRS